MKNESIKVKQSDDGWIFDPKNLPDKGVEVYVYYNGRQDVMSRCSKKSPSGKIKVVWIHGSLYVDKVQAWRPKLPDPVF